MKQITRIVLTGGPAAGKTTLISRILKEFKQEDGWRVITIPETATELISGFGIKPFGDCVSMEQFQYYVIDDMLHKEKLALKAAEEVPEEKILIIYDRAILGVKAYINDEQFAKTIAHFGKTEQEIIAGYDAIIHMVSCAKGAEYAYNFGNAARYESVEVARDLDDRTLRASSTHPNLYIIDNSADFEDKINRSLAVIYSLVGQSAPEDEKRKFLIAMPDVSALMKERRAVPVEMMQTYLASSKPKVVRRIRQQRAGGEYLYFYTEKRSDEDGRHWVTEKPISQKEYVAYLMESDLSMHPVRKTKYRLNYNGMRMEIDIYPFSADKAVLFVYGKRAGEAKLPEELELIREVTGEPEYKNSALARRQTL